MEPRSWIHHPVLASCFRLGARAFGKRLVRFPKTHLVLASSSVCFLCHPLLFVHSLAMRKRRDQFSYAVEDTAVSPSSPLLHLTSALQTAVGGIAEPHQVHPLPVDGLRNTTLRKHTFLLPAGSAALERHREGSQMIAAGRKEPLACRTEAIRRTAAAEQSTRFAGAARKRPVLVECIQERRMAAGVFVAAEMVSCRQEEQNAMQVSAADA